MTKRARAKRDKAIALLRASGLTCRTIAGMYGLTYQRVQQICSRYPEFHRMPLDVSDAIDEIARVLHGAAA